MFNKSGSNVLECFIKQRIDPMLHALLTYLATKHALLYTVSHQYGNYVVQTILKTYSADPLIKPLIQSIKDNIKLILDSDIGMKLVQNTQDILKVPNLPLLKSHGQSKPNHSHGHNSHGHGHNSHHNHNSHNNHNNHGHTGGGKKHSNNHSNNNHSANNLNSLSGGYYGPPGGDSLGYGGMGGYYMEGGQRGGHHSHQHNNQHSQHNHNQHNNHSHGAHNNQQADRRDGRYQQQFGGGYHLEEGQEGRSGHGGHHGGHMQMQHMMFSQTGQDNSRLPSHSQPYPYSQQPCYGMNVNLNVNLNYSGGEAKRGNGGHGGGKGHYTYNEGGHSHSGNQKRQTGYMGQGHQTYPHKKPRGRLYLLKETFTASSWFS